MTKFTAGQKVFGNFVGGVVVGISDQKRVFIGMDSNETRFDDQLYLVEVNTREGRGFWN